MKIDCIRTHHLACKLHQPFGFSQWYYDQRHVLLVEVVTDEGATGWGECYGPAAVIEAAVAEFYAPRMLGCDPSGVDALWHRMWRASLDFARRGVMMAAMSGIDMALWDLRGKLLGLPVCELLGGCQRESVPCYATGMYFVDGQTDEALIARLVDEAEGYAAQGFTALKIKVGKNVDFDIALVRGMRERLPQTTLMSDANHAYDLAEATRVGAVLDECGYSWFEEPLSPEHPELHRKLSQKLRVPIASGECEQTRWGFQQLLSAGGVQIAQPDLAYCGGPSEALRIRGIASSLGVNLVPHVWGTMFNLAAATHFLATSYQEPGRAETDQLLLEYDRTENPLRDKLFAQPLEVCHGRARVPRLPGLGVSIDPQALAHFEVKGTETR